MKSGCALNISISISIYNIYLYKKYYQHQLHKYQQRQLFTGSSFFLIHFTLYELYYSNSDRIEKYWTTLKTVLKFIKETKNKRNIQIKQLSNLDKTIINL